jgi:Lysylphosphatidylglycerol synthase TM region
MLNRLRSSPWIRATLLAVVLAFCGYGIHLEWPQMRTALGHLHWCPVAASALAAMAGSTCMMVAWRGFLADLGSRLPLPVAARASFLGQLAKYIPGGVWSIAAQVELAYDYGAPRRRSTTSVLVTLSVMVAVGLAIAAVLLPLTAGGAAGHYLWFLALIPVIAVCLYPPVLTRLVNTALRLVRQQPLDQVPSLAGLARAAAWTALGWLFMGTQAWLVLSDLTRDSPRLALLSVGAFALACCVGYLVVVIPSGLGAREVIFITAVATLVPHGPATAAAIVIRLTSTASDLTLGGLALLLGRSARAALAPPSPTAPPPAAAETEHPVSR